MNITRIIFVIFFATSLYAQKTAFDLVPHYLYQFANHIQKANEANTYKIHIIADDMQLKRDFIRVLGKYKVRGKAFEISQSRTLYLPKDVNMVFLGLSSNVLFSSVNKSLHGRSVLLVSFEEKDKREVMINLFMTEKQKLSFEINRANILNEKFTISDKVVLMGGTELDVAKLFKGAKQTLKEKEKVLQEKDKQLRQANDKLLVLENKTQKYLADIEKAKRTIKNITKETKKEKKIYEEQIVRNEILQKQLLENKKNNIKIQEELSVKLTEIQKKDEQIRSKEHDLEHLNKDIAIKEKILDEIARLAEQQKQKISIQESTIVTQQSTLVWLGITLLLFILLLFIIFAMFKKQRETSEALQNTLHQLKDTQNELVESSKMASLGEVVAGVAHEMNTPIGVSITGVSVLRNGNHDLKKKLEENKLKQSDLMEFIQIVDDVTNSLNVSLEKASQLVQSFKQVSVDQQTEAIRKFDFSEYLEMVLISFKRQLKHKNVNVHIDGDKSILIYSYPGVFYQIITNLLNNTLQHAFNDDSGGDIWISFNVLDEKLHLVYRDNGKGVSKENLVKIFEPFYTTARGKGGTGLGLHIIYNLITQKLGGSIKAKSAQNEGMTLEMKFPLVIE